MKLTKETLKQIIKEELAAVMEDLEDLGEAGSMSPFQRKVAAQKAKSDAEELYRKHKKELDAAVAKYQVPPSQVSDKEHLDTIMKIVPDINREQARAIASLFSDEMEMVKEELAAVMEEGYAPLGADKMGRAFDYSPEQIQILKLAAERLNEFSRSFQPEALQKITYHLKNHKKFKNLKGLEQKDLQNGLKKYGYNGPLMSTFAVMEDQDLKGPIYTSAGAYQILDPNSPSDVGFFKKLTSVVNPKAKDSQGNPIPAEIQIKAAAEEALQSRKDGGYLRSVPIKGESWVYLAHANKNDNKGWDWYDKSKSIEVLPNTYTRANPDEYKV